METKLPGARTCIFAPGNFIFNTHTEKGQSRSFAFCKPFYNAVSIKKP